MTDMREDVAHAIWRGDTRLHVGVDPTFGDNPFEGFPEDYAEHYREYLADAAIAAATPHIERDVIQRIIAVIRAEADDTVWLTECCTMVDRLEMMLVEDVEVAP